MSKFYKQEYTSQRGHRFAVYIPTKDLPKGLRIEIVMYNANDARGTPHLSLFPYKHKDREGWENKYDLITCVKLTEKVPKTVDDIVPLEGNPTVPLEYKNAVFQWANEADNWETAKSSWESCKKRFIQDVDVRTITNEQIISLFPSKAVREYLTNVQRQLKIFYLLKVMKFLLMFVMLFCNGQKNQTTGKLQKPAGSLVKRISYKM